MQIDTLSSLFSLGYRRTAAKRIECVESLHQSEPVNQAQDSVGPSPFDSLPVEVHLRVFAFCCDGGNDLQMLGRLAKVSCTWNALSRSGDLITFISMARSTRKDKVQVLATLAQRSGGFLRHLDLRGCTNMSSSYIKQIPTVCPNIRFLNLSRCNSITSAQLISVIRRLPFLTHVDLSGLRCTSDITLDILSRPGKLLSLDVSYCRKVKASGLKFVVERCKNLASLYLSGLGIVNDSLMAAMSHLSTLQQLDIAESDDVTSRGLQLAFLEPSSHSQFLALVPAYTNTEEDMHLPTPPMKFMPALTQMTSINFSNLSLAVTDDVFTVLAWSTPNLRSIICRNALALTDVGVSRLAEGCIQLENVDLGGCVLVGDAGLLALGLCCGKRLSVVRAPFCPRISAEGVRVLLSLCVLLNTLTLDSCAGIDDSLLKMLEHDPCPALHTLDLYGCSTSISQAGIARALAAVNKPIVQQQQLIHPHRTLIRRGSVDSDMTLTELNDRISAIKLYSKREKELVIRTDSPSVFNQVFGRRASTSGLMDILFRAF
ncbi:hypothetical protein HDU81_003391 [Chytriomyces hyalinus]|nr:hypothetical protein HDU81_003391 [Chytriomyces hyalinus]